MRVLSLVLPLIRCGTLGPGAEPTQTGSTRPRQREQGPHFSKGSRTSAHSKSALRTVHLQQKHTVFFTSNLGFVSISVVLSLPSINKLSETPLAF